MNQKNVFTVVGVVYLLQGIMFYLMADKLVLQAYPNLVDESLAASMTFIQLASVLLIFIGLATYAARNSAEVLWAFALGSAVFLCGTLKHMFIDDIAVPIPAVVIQVAVALAYGYLWMQGRKA